MTEIPANTRPLDGPKPKLKAPPCTVDTHVHFFLEGHEPQPGGPPIAELATLEDYAVVQRRLGLERVVVTQPNAYRFDNGATLEALERFGPERARAVVAVSPDMTVADLESLHAKGARAARIMDLPGGAVPIAKMKPVERLAREVGWHLILQFNGRELDRHLDALRGIETDFVIDHIGKFIDPVPADDPRVDAMLRLVDAGRAWIKISACYETSLTGGPDYEDVAPIAKRFIGHAPERMIWSTNWPHVGVPRERYPDDGPLLDVLLDWASPEARQKILVDNPARLYGF